MFHHVAKARQGLLISTWEEAHTLWGAVLGACPGARAVCLMPNHLHVQHPRDVRIPLAHALGSYAQARNHRLGHSGRVLAPLPPPKWAADQQKVRRETRYIHLNPCRAGIVEDPLAWPWSTYRDALGICLDPARELHPQPGRLHLYTSSDAHVSPHGTSLPAASGEYELESLRAATSAATRQPLAVLSKRGPARALWIQSARVLSGRSVREIADYVGVSRRTVARCPSCPSEATQLIAQLAGDPRFPGIGTGLAPWVRRSWA